MKHPEECFSAFWTNRLLSEVIDFFAFVERTSKKKEHEELLIEAVSLKMGWLVQTYNEHLHAATAAGKLFDKVLACNTRQSWLPLQDLFSKHEIELKLNLTQLKQSFRFFNLPEMASNL